MFWDVFAVAGRLVEVFAVAVALFGVRAMWLLGREEVAGSASAGLVPADILAVPVELGRCEACGTPTAFRFCLAHACGICGEYALRRFASSIDFALCSTCQAVHGG